MYRAFAEEAVVEELGLSVECLHVAGDTLLAGTRDGTLVVIGQDVPEGCSAAEPGSPWYLLEAYKHFAKRPLLQLQTAEEDQEGDDDGAAAGGRQLLSVSEDGVAVSRLVPGTRTAYEAEVPAMPRTKGASLIALDPCQHMLAVAVKRRLLLFQRSADGQYSEVKEAALPDPIKAMAWAGKSLCVAYRREYALVSTETGAVTELFGVGNGQQPLIAPLPGGEILVNREGAGAFLNWQGKPSRKAAMAWSEPPVQVVASPPYALAVLPNKAQIEVRSLERTSTHSLVQTVPLPPGTKAVAVGSDGSVAFAAGNGGAVRRLVPVPLLDQIRGLEERGDFQAALNLCLLLPGEGDDEGAAQRQALEDRLHLRFGEALLRLKEFEEALAHLSMCSRPSPVHLLHLFPSLAPQLPATRRRAARLLDKAWAAAGEDRSPPPQVPEPEPLGGQERQRAMSTVLPYLMSYRGRLANGGLTEEGAGGGSGSGSGDRELLVMLVDTAIMQAMLDMNDTGALLGFVRRSNNVDMAEGERALVAAGRYAELVALYEGAGWHQKALDLLHKLSQDPGSLEVAAKGAGSELVGLPGVWAAVRYCARLGSSHASMVMDFSGWILKADPEAGLEMFLEMDPPLATSKVLSHLRASAPIMCAPFLEAALSRGLADPAEYHSELVLIYLQEARDQEKDGDSSSTGKDEPADEGTTGECGPTGSSRTERMGRLERLVSTSPHLDLERILSWLPKGSLVQIRLLLLQRLGRTREVLKLIISSMGSVTLAEEYCDFVYTHYYILQQRRARTAAGVAAPDVPTAGPAEQLLPAPVEAQRGNMKFVPPDSGGDQEGRPSSASAASSRAAQPDIYLHLMQVMLEPEPGSKAPCARTDSRVMARVAKLLSRKQHRINPAVALTLLPGDVALADVMPFLEGALRGMREEEHNTSIVRNLRRGENLQVREELVLARSRRVVVTGERACVLCHKRIGNSVFASYPDGTLVHFACYKRSVTVSSNQAAADTGHKPPGTAQRIAGGLQMD